MSTEIPAHAIASYDQALKESESLLSVLTAMYREARSNDEARGFPEPLSVVSCSRFLLEGISHEECASALAVAILAFTRFTDRQETS